MIEKIIFDFLKTIMQEPVFMEVPDKAPQRPPSTFILVEKTSSAQSDFINTATIAIQSYAPTLYAAATLNERVKDAMLNDATGLAAQNSVYGVDLNADYNYTDTTKKVYRYQAIFDIYY